MKRIIFILLLAFVAFASNAQVTKPIVLDTVQGAETVYFTPSYSGFFTGSTTYTGIVGIQFDIDNVKDSTSAIGLYGSVDGIGYVLVSSLSLTNTEGTYMLSDVAPDYIKYRLAATCIAGDTVIIKAVTYIEKQ